MCWNGLLIQPAIHSKTQCLHSSNIFFFQIELISWVDNAAADEYSKLTSEEKRGKTFQEMLQVVHGEREMGNEHFMSHHYAKASRCYNTAVRLLEGVMLKDITGV